MHKEDSGGRGGSAGQVLVMGFTQIIAWASSTYIPAVISIPVADELHLPRSLVYGAFSFSLPITALSGPAVGRRIDKSGGRRMLMLSNFVFALGLLLSGVRDAVGLFAAWAVLGLGMGLYDAAFATFVYLKGQAARKSIVGVTLLGGFASTVGWPVSAYVLHHWNWQAVCLFWAGVHLLVALPLHYVFVRGPKARAAPDKTAQPALAADADADASVAAVSCCCFRPTAG